MSNKIAWFTHLLVEGFGWETTILLEEDFKNVEELGRNDIDGIIFLGIQENGVKRILKGRYRERERLQSP